MNVARGLAGTLLVVLCGGVAWGAPDPASADPTALASCEIVGPAEIGDILGFGVQPPDETSRAEGICFFATRAVSEEGSASYAIVTTAGLAQRRALFAALARRCALLPAIAPGASACATYEKLATAADLDAYFAARTSGGSATTLSSGGSAAFATDEAIYVRSGARVIEAIVKRGESLDVDRSKALASLLLARSRP